MCRCSGARHTSLIRPCCPLPLPLLWPASMTDTHAGHAIRYKGLDHPAHELKRVWAYGKQIFVYCGAPAVLPLRSALPCSQHRCPALLSSALLKPVCRVLVQQRTPALDCTASSHFLSRHRTLSAMRPPWLAIVLLLLLAPAAAAGQPAVAAAPAAEPGAGEAAPLMTTVAARPAFFAAVRTAP